jgi:hypothetical protein
MVIRLPAFDPIEFLVCRKYPHPPWGESSDLTTPSSVNERQEQLAARDAYRQELEALEPAHIAARCAEERKRDDAERKAKAELVEKALFFHQPSANADFEHWSRASYWTLEEAVALSFGKTPTVVNSNSLSLYTRMSAFAANYTQRLELAKRAAWAKQLWEPSYPSIFLAWANRMEIAVAPELVEAVKARGIQIADWKSLYDDLNMRHTDLKGRYDGLVADRDASVAKLQAMVTDTLQPSPNDHLSREP